MRRSSQTPCAGLKISRLLGRRAALMAIVSLIAFVSGSAGLSPASSMAAAFAGTVNLSIQVVGQRFLITASGAYTVFPSELDVYVHSGATGCPASRQAENVQVEKQVQRLGPNMAAALITYLLGNNLKTQGTYSQQGYWGGNLPAGQYWACAYLLVPQHSGGDPADPPQATDSAHMTVRTAGSPPAPAAGVVIKAFYPATSMSLDAAKPTPRVSRFDSGISGVSFYIVVRGASSGRTHLRIVTRGPGGAQFATRDVGVATSANYSVFIIAGAPHNAVYPDGSFTADLLVDGKVAAHTSFTVGVAVDGFYTTSFAAYNAFSKGANSPAPPRTASFSTSTLAVYLYVSYVGARARSTRMQFVVRTPSGATLKDPVLVTLEHTNGSVMIQVPAPKLFYAAGSYTSEVLINGRVAARTAFTIGRSQAATISVFYPSTKAALNAWTTSRTAAPPPRTNSFPTGTTAVAFYFVSKGATPNVTKVGVIIRNRSGTVVAGIDATPLTDSSAVNMRLVLAPGGKPFPAGAYTAEALVDGRTAARTSFTVGTASTASISAFYPITEAAYNAWGTHGNYAAPRPTVTFASGTKVVAFYIKYRGARPHVTTNQVIIYYRSGAAYFTGKVHVFAGSSSDIVRGMDNGAPFPAGAYHADLKVDGHVAARTNFQVRG
jgi:hypothetical protein